MTLEQPATANAQRVLVVDDLPDARDSLQMLLQIALGLEVDTAQDGVDALARLARQPYGLVITDLRMPRMDGMRLVEEIRDRKLGCPVIVVTGHGSIQEAAEAMRLGAYDFVTKPPDPQQFMMTIQKALRRAADPGRSDPPAGPG